MKIADVVGALDSWRFAEVGFAIAAVAFLIVLATTFLDRNRAAFDRASYLPLTDDDTEANGPSDGQETRNE